VNSGNAVEYQLLRPGEQRTQAISFTSNAPVSVFASASQGVPVAIKLNVGDASCEPLRWSMRVAPVPHLQIIQKTAAALIAAVVIPILIELYMARHRRREPANAGQTPSARRTTRR
jgi:hypothetical protein